MHRLEDARLRGGCLLLLLPLTFPGCSLTWIMELLAKSVLFGVLCFHSSSLLPLPISPSCVILTLPHLMPLCFGTNTCCMEQSPDNCYVSYMRQGSRSSSSSSRPSYSVIHLSINQFHEKYMPFHPHSGSVSTTILNAAAGGQGSINRLNSSKKPPELATQQSCQQNSSNRPSFFSQFSTFTEVAAGSMQERIYRAG